MDTLLFKEIQRFRSPWGWLIVIGLNLLFAWAFVQQIIFDKPWGSNPASNFVLVLISLIPIGILILFLTVRFETGINENGIYYMFFPFHFKRHLIDWKNVDKAFIREYNPISEYGGWGIRFWFGYGNAYNISGNKGIQLEFKNGKRLLFGTQKPKDIEEVLQQLTYKKIINQSS